MSSQRFLLIPALSLSLLFSCAEETKTASVNTSVPLAAAAEGELTQPALVALVEESLRAAKELPSDATRRATLGLVYEANRKWALGASAFQHAAELDPTAPEYPLHAAICLLSGGSAEAGSALLRDTASKHPDFAPARYRLGAMLVDDGDAEGALAEFKECELLANWFRNIRVVIAEAFIVDGRPGEALALIDEFLPGRTYDLYAHYVRGLALTAMNRDTEAETFLTMGKGSERSYLPDKLSDRLASYILDTADILRRADAFRSAGQDRRAQDMLNSALESQPDDPGLLNSLAMFERRAGNLAEALTMLERSAQFAPEMVDVWINLSLVRYDLGQHQAGLEAAEKACELAPTNSQAEYLRGRSLRSLGKFDEALKAFKGSLRLDDSSNQTRLSLAEAYIQLNQFAPAKSLLSNLVERNPNEYWARHYLSIAQLRLGFSAEAREGLEQLKSLYPEDSRLAQLEALFQ